MTIAKAALATALNQPLTIEELEWEEPRNDEIGIRVIACGLCRSDWHCLIGEAPVPFPCLLGHEGGGVVEKIGKDVKRVKVGDKVVMSWIASCGHCPSCVSGQGQLCDQGATALEGRRDDGTCRVRDKKGNEIPQIVQLGAFSEYVVIPEDACILIDQDLDPAKIALIGCRLPTGFGAVVNAAKATYGCTALVVGLGGIGFNVIQGLKSVGASIIIAADIHDKKKWAMEWGATHYIDASKQNITEEVMKITGIGADYAFDAIGDSEVQSMTVESIHKGGRAVWAGVVPYTQNSVNLNAFTLTLFQKSICGTCYGGASPFEMVPKLLKMYKSGVLKIDELVTKEYKLEQINEGFADMLAGKNICGVIRF